MTAVKSYRDLVVWQKAMELAQVVYESTATWPREELDALTSQIRRSAVSVPSNIAEGQGRTSTKEFMNHLSIAYGSLMERETQALLAQRLGYLSPSSAGTLLERTAEVGRLLNGLAAALSRRQAAKTVPPTGHRPLTTDHSP